MEYDCTGRLACAACEARDSRVSQAPATECDHLEGRTPPPSSRWPAVVAEEVLLGLG